jgi:hypothetical protein
MTKIRNVEIEFKKPSYKYPFVWFGFDKTHYVDLFLKILVFHTSNQINRWYGQQKFILYNQLV